MELKDGWSKGLMFTQKFSVARLQRNIPTVVSVTLKHPVCAKGLALKCSLRHTLCVRACTHVSFLWIYLKIQQMHYIAIQSVIITTLCTATHCDPLCGTYIQIYRSLATGVWQPKIWHFWVICIERNVCRCTFNRYSVITQFVKLAAGEQLCRRCTHRKV